MVPGEEAGCRAGAIGRKEGKVLAGRLQAAIPGSAEKPGRKERSLVELQRRSPGNRWASGRVTSRWSRSQIPSHSAVDPGDVEGPVALRPGGQKKITLHPLILGEGFRPHFSASCVLVRLRASSGRPSRRNEPGRSFRDGPPPGEESPRRTGTSSGPPMRTRTRKPKERMRPRDGAGGRLPGA